MIRHGVYNKAGSACKYPFNNQQVFRRPGAGHVLGAVFRLNRNPIFEMLDGMLQGGWGMVITPFCTSVIQSD